MIFCVKSKLFMNSRHISLTLHNFLMPFYAFSHTYSTICHAQSKAHVIMMNEIDTGSKHRSKLILVRNRSCCCWFENAADNVRSFDSLDCGAFSILDMISRGSIDWSGQEGTDTREPQTAFANRVAIRCFYKILTQNQTALPFITQKSFFHCTLQKCYVFCKSRFLNCCIFL